jgi:hypothetical protein
MEKKRIKQIAREFCEARDIEPTIAAIYSRVNFAEHLIEKGVFVEAEKLPLSNISAVKKIDNIRNNVPVVGKGSENWYKSYANALRKNGLIITEATTAKQPTVSSAGKEVRTPFDDDLLKASYKMLEQRNRDLEKEVKHYRDQFKATPAKEITDQDIEEAADDHAQGRFVDHVRDSFEAFKEGAKWYQSQLKAKP